MNKIHYCFILILFSFLLPKESYSSVGLGGEIKWHCLGSGEYVFELVFYRDCNGAQINTNYESLEVWGHPTLTSIKVNYISRTDISPSCTPSGGETPILCGSGVGGGTGLGAVEKIIYRSDPILITGTPPQSGWHFTYQSFSRSMNIDNLQNPNFKGITIAAAMYPILGGQNGKCIDNSPMFLQDPYINSCAGETYYYNPNVVDVDLDSLHFSWGKPLDYFLNATYNPPTTPPALPFVSGYSYTNPTPDASFDSQNQGAALDNKTGELTLKSVTTGAFTTKIIIDSYRNGKKIASVSRETPIMIAACSGTNTAPTITPPFANGTSFDTTVIAGDLVQFDLNAIDIEFLQDGVTPQTITIAPTGMMYGTNYVSATSGCNKPPCATLSPAPLIQSPNNATTQLSWQTTCDHLEGITGIAQNNVPYTFVFKVTDDYCKVPKTRFATVTINVKNEGVLPAPEIECITTNASGDVIVQWTPITDPLGSFVSYEIKGVNGGSYGSISNISTSSFTIPGGVGGGEQFYISTLSGCGGKTIRNSDTISSVSLNLLKPGNGTAVLNWNAPSPTKKQGYNDYFHIYKEYPAGIWTLLDSVPYATTHYRDTIMICEDFINYRIELITDNCIFSSEIAGDIFKDKIVPDIPDIYTASIDTLTGDVVLSWSENGQSDTYGYVIYKKDNSGNFIEIDTVWGISNTTYIYDATDAGPFTFSVAAFDSCYTTNINPTFQTSAKATPHTTNFMSSVLNICNRLLSIEWTGYIGYDAIKEAQIYAKINGKPWELVGTTTNSTFSMNVAIGDEIIIAVQTVSVNGVVSFSNTDTIHFQGNSEPDMSYLSTATVQEDHIIIKHNVSLLQGVEYIQLQKWNHRIQKFENIATKNVTNNSEIIFKDYDVEVNKRSYRYKTRAIDTCGNPTGNSNNGNTILLSVNTNQLKKTHLLQWSPYSEFIGGTFNYEVYRAVQGQFDPNPIAVLPYNMRTFTDSVATISETDDGKICYKVIAVEGTNKFGERERSSSNTVCALIQPTIYIPNAFTVGGKNPVFKPVTSNHKVEHYLLEIYDRYGRVIFSTDNPDEGWDGRLEGQNRIASEGVYIYRLSLENGAGNQLIKYGNITLLDYR